MMSEFATALAPNDYDPDVLRSGLVGRVIYALSGSENPEAFVALVDGRVPPALAFNNIVFWLDPDDTTSDGDGVAVVKTADHFVYKVEDPDYRIRAVLSDAVTAPPASPAIGDAYLVPAGPTGGWSSHQDDIAIFTRNGWRFEIPVIGKWLLIESADGFKRYTVAGWQYGPGARSFDSNSIPLSATLGFGERVIVENQTTNAPPAATKGLRYVVGPLPTGAWLGKTKQIAICEVVGTWTFYPASNGWEISDKSRHASFIFNGAQWVSTAGAFIDTKSVASTVNADLVATIPLDDTFPKSDEGSALITTTYSPKSATNILRIRFTGTASHNTNGGYAIAALFLNANSDALAGDVKGGITASAMLCFDFVHEFVAGTTSDITLSIRVGPAASGGGKIRFNGSPANRFLGGVMAARLTIDEIVAA